MSELNGGAAVARALAACGVELVFGIPGTHNLEIYRGLSDVGIRAVNPRHEQGAAYGADAYARVTGRPGVVVTTSGPGLTNAITGLATAYADSVPVLVISPGPPRGLEGADVGWLHEMKDQQGVLDAAIARSVRVTDAADIPAAMLEVWQSLTTGRPRPVHLEIPTDVLEESWEPVEISAPETLTVPAPETDAIAVIAAALTRARRPVIVAGGGALNAAAELRELADRGISIVTSARAKGVVDEANPRSWRASLRMPTTHAALDAADVVIGVGTEFADSDLWGGVIAPGGPGRTVVRIDIDPAQLDKNVTADVRLLADARAALRAILDQLPSDLVTDAEWADGAVAAITTEEQAETPIWAAIQTALSAALPADTIVAGDSSQVTYYGTIHHWRFGGGQILLYPTGFATLGYGIPAAIGAKLAAPEQPVIALLGDGAAMFSIQEVMLAVELRLPIPFVIVDNAGYAEIREQMIDRGIPTVSVDLQTPDLAALGKALGAHGATVHTPAGLASVVASALDADGPTVVHFPLA